MTEGQTLLAEYAKTGSEAAFRELVTRYLGLVYSTALRLLNGDTHLAEDAAQTVFMDLAHKARGISTQVMLGGWLHRHTYNVAAHMIRARRRRQTREREASQMKALQNDPDANLHQIAPVLDEAIMRLGEEDRTAICLRFFERRDFRSIGEALGSTEDAARMRVNRALNKLHALLTRKGVALSTTTLGAALASESLTAAPTSLVANVVASVVAGSAPTGGICTTLLKLTTMAKVKYGILAAAIITGAATSLVILQYTMAKLNQQQESIRQQLERLAQLHSENERLKIIGSRVTDAKDEFRDLPRLRAEAESLRGQKDDLSLLQADIRRLKKALADTPKTPLQVTERRMTMIEFEKSWMLAFRQYAMEHQDQFPTSFEQAAPFFPSDAKVEPSEDTDQFEVFKQPFALTLTNVNMIVLREKEPSPGWDGKLTRVYGMADGSVQSITVPMAYRDPNGKRVSYDNFETWEKQHTIHTSGQ